MVQFEIELRFVANANESLTEVHGVRLENASLDHDCDVPEPRGPLTFDWDSMAPVALSSFQ